MNGKLRAMAAKVGANAVINVEYHSGVSMTSWKSMKGTGLAVRKMSDEVACPECAETIKRAAKKCRFCGAEIALAPAAAPAVETVGPAVGNEPAQAAPTAAQALDEPLRETNNPQTWLIVGAVLFVLVMLIGIASGT